MNALRAGTLISTSVLSERLPPYANSWNALFYKTSVPVRYGGKILGRFVILRVSECANFWPNLKIRKRTFLDAFVLGLASDVETSSNKTLDVYRLNTNLKETSHRVHSAPRICQSREYFYEQRLLESRGNSSMTGRRVSRNINSPIFTKVHRCVYSRVAVILR